MSILRSLYRFVINRRLLKDLVNKIDREIFILSNKSISLSESEINRLKNLSDISKNMNDRINQRSNISVSMIALIAAVISPLYLLVLYQLPQLNQGQQIADRNYENSIKEKILEITKIDDSEVRRRRLRTLYDLYPEDKTVQKYSKIEGLISIVSAENNKIEKEITLASKNDSKEKACKDLLANIEKLTDVGSFIVPSHDPNILTIYSRAANDYTLQTVDRSYLNRINEIRNQAKSTYAALGCS